MSSAFGGELMWPKGESAYRVEFSLSCGWVIVNPDGQESTLGYANKDQAEDVAEKMNEAYQSGLRDGVATKDQRSGY